MRVSLKYLENFHVSRTSRELVAKFLNRFIKVMQMFSSKYFARLSRDCRNNENEKKPHSRESRETLSRMSRDCRATVARQSRVIFSKLDRNSRICRLNVHSMRMQRKSCVCLIDNLCREIVQNYSRTSLQLSHQLSQLVSHWHANFSRLFCEFCRGHSHDIRASVARVS